MKMRSMGWAASILVIGISGMSWGIAGEAPRQPEAVLAAARVQADDGAGSVLAEAVPLSSSVSTDEAAASGKLGGATNVPTSGSTFVDKNGEPAAPAAIPQLADAPLPLERINGLAVTDDLKTIYELKGEPIAVETEPLFPDERILIYEDCKVGLYLQSVQAVMVPASVGEIVIDGRKLPLDAEELKAVLGTPDWVAEDGIVYKHGGNALKLFIDPEQDKLLSVHLFHNGSL
ncbi:hypothetical protein [Paenibacillus puerhi]|uniref:hypothetical protein n=1 Tax=Paenibacillus puerhi TaxID=2692622 RepID=UPI00135C80A6|nr:hypothetical protein [Paenibacillus puerhi]